jgi:hypothetical protein
MDARSTNNHHPAAAMENAAMFKSLATRTCKPVIALAALSSLLPAAIGFAGPASAAGRAPIFANHSQPMMASARSYTFETLDNKRDLTFNQLLGIDDAGLIVGYFGSGASPQHPNKGYTLKPPYTQMGDYHGENFPGSTQTQVTGLNQKNDTCGFWVDANGNNFGFIEWNGVFTSYTDPNIGTGTVTQILGINNAGTAVGFYTDGSGVNHGFKLNQATGKFTEILITDATNVTVSGINDNGNLTGFATTQTGKVVGFLIKNNALTEFSFPKAVATNPLGISDSDEIVGSFVDRANATHGFTLTDPLMNAKFQQIDDPNGIGNTVVNGVNSSGQLVGFYVDGAGNTDGFLAQ